MDQHRKKMVAPIVIAAVFAAWCIGYACLLFAVFPLPPGIKLVGGGVLLALAGAMLVVLRGRLREIKGGETDDLGNY